MIKMVIAGTEFKLSPCAISTVRYRAAYGRSIVTDLAGCKTAEEAEGRLVRMCYEMLPVADRPELLDFARLAGRDEYFYFKAESARAALLNVDESAPVPDETGSEPFDEYSILALMTAAKLDMGLIYELPIMHIVGIVARIFELQDPDRRDWRPMTQEERRALYPRRKKQ